jgi:ABC-type lipoprotein export system ATPase subunit
LLADEPTGALDSTTSEQVLELLGELHRQGMTIVIVTHDPTVAAHASRVITFSDGHMLNDMWTRTPESSAGVASGEGAS